MNTPTQLSDRLPENVPGPWFITDACIICGLCDELAPGIFRPLEDFSFNHVYHQPVNDEEEELAREAAESCPVEAICRE
ncbi:MAG: ferredoxin [Verrucomicrobiales bacterium]|nr:ferredoxin [Verrucomicrobiales bacterium]